MVRFQEIQDARHQLLRLGTRNERTAIALQRQTAEIPFAQDILDRFAGGQARHATAHRLQIALRRNFVQMRQKKPAPALQQARRQQLCGHRRIGDTLSLQIGDRQVEYSPPGFHQNGKSSGSPASAGTSGASGGCGTGSVAVPSALMTSIFQPVRSVK